MDGVLAEKLKKSPQKSKALALLEPDTSDTDFCTPNANYNKIENFKNKQNNIEVFSNVISETTTICNMDSKVPSNNNKIHFKSPTRKDINGKLIEKFNKKNYHISFRDQVTKLKLIDFVNIPDRNSESGINVDTDEKHDKEIKNDQQSCVCLIF